MGFAGSCGVGVDDLERVRTDKGEWLAFRSKQTGKPAKRLIPDCIEQSIKQLPIPKRMRWSDLDAEFVRPVHWLVILHGKERIKANILSVRAGSTTLGHRFHSTGPLDLSEADDYEKALLEKGFVIADYEKRKALIARQISALARRRDGVVGLDEALLEEVTSLVEWPHALAGRFDPVFLDLPPEVLVSSMRDNQKYFHLRDDTGGLLPFFITVSNIVSNAPARVRKGNERVLRARLEDAKFFWDSDRRQTLEQHAEGLRYVLFHERLGSVADKCQRLQELVKYLAPLCHADTVLCERAAQLVKADLVTDMVGEFPDLQGIMGRYYAAQDGEPTEVSHACAEHYQPRFAGDQLPESQVGKIVGLADRLDSLVGMFAAGEEPSGDKDPYGLRRAALAVLRILVEGELDLKLPDLLSRTADVFRSHGATGLKLDSPTIDNVAAFVNDRLQSYYSDQGFAADEIAAVNAVKPARPYDFDQRLRAVSKFRQLEAARNLAAANKRIRNILKQAGCEVTHSFDVSLAGEVAEKDLAERLRKLKTSVSDCFDNDQYEAGLNQLASLREPVDHFFDEVMVMAEDESLRTNRLALLHDLQDLFLRVADISYLQETGDGS